MFGGPGDDKILMAVGTATTDQQISGGRGDDIIYGVDYGYGENLYGDLRFELDGYGVLTEGGEDKIYGSDNLLNDQFIHGGKGNDFIMSGNNTGGDIKIYGDLDSMLFGL